MTGDNNVSGVQINGVDGSNNQFNINQAPQNPHPITSQMGLRWTLKDFSETVRNGNLPAITEYLNPKDGFSPNTLDGSFFVLQLPIVEGTRNFPDILQIFKSTGKLDWTTVNDKAAWSDIYAHPITMEWQLLKEAANKAQPDDLRALLNAGASPSQFIADQLDQLKKIPRGGNEIFKGPLTGRGTNSYGANVERDLLTFQQIGYPLPGLQAAVGPANPAAPGEPANGEPCKQYLRAHYDLKTLMSLATDPQALESQQNWQAHQKAASFLQERLLGVGWRGNHVEYESAITNACR